MTTYGLALMVKDEAAVIDQCLASVRPHISAWTVVDTGSTDDTPERVERALEGIPGKLWRLPFVNFGHSRSELLVAARGTADWLLCMDADSTIEIDPDFAPDPVMEAYMVDFGWQGFENRLPLLLRGDLPWKSIGAVHEATCLPDRMYVSMPTDQVRIKHHGVRDNGPAKWKWHASLIEAELAHDPTNARSTFYLAETYARLGDSANARRLYRQRAAMVGFPEETWYAGYQAALLEPDWPQRQVALQQSWENWPARLEPLHDIVVELNRLGQHQAAYQLASARTPPIATGLFRHTDVWDWGLLFQRSIAAWWVGKRAESRTLSLDLLANPRLPASVRDAVQRNLALTPEEAVA